MTKFIGEAKLVADLVHENIIQVYQLDRTADMLYIVMEYIDGIDLARFMTLHTEQARLAPLDLCAFIVSRVCRGLDYAHTKLDRDHSEICPFERCDELHVGDVLPRQAVVVRDE